jgi:hypothetical protein
VIGYYGIFSGFEVINNAEILNRLDGDKYAGSQAITLRIPISLPYSTNQNTYERVDGKFNHDGEIYRLVKQKLYNDTLFVICIKDEKGTKIENTLNDLGRAFSDNGSESKSPAKLVFTFIKDFEPHPSLNVIGKFSLLYSLRPLGQSFVYCLTCVDSIDHPPQG